MKTKQILAALALTGAIAITAANTRAQTSVPAPSYAPSAAPVRYQYSQQQQYTYQDPMPVAGFVRLVFGYTKPATGHSDGTGVFGMAGGVMLGQNQEHEIGLEILGSSYDTRYYYDAKGRWAGSSTTWRTPILVNYRYYFRIPRSPLSLYIGGGAGCEIVSVSSNLGGGHYYDPYYGYYYDGNSDSSIAFAAAGTAGISITLSRYIDLEIGYQGMWQSGGNTNLYSYTNNQYTRIASDTPSGWVHFVIIGATFRF